MLCLVEFKVHLMTPDSVSKSDSDAASDSESEDWTQSHSHSPSCCMDGMEMKLEGQVLCGALVCNSHSPIPNRDL